MLLFYFALDLLLSYSVLCSFSREKRGKEDVPDELIVYRNLDELLDLIRRDPSPVGRMIVDTFQSECRHPYSPYLLSSVPPQPFIVIEGNHRKSREYVAKGLARMLNGRQVSHPAPCLIKHLNLLPRGSFLRRAFFHLSNYASSFYVKSQPDRPIVMNGYWTEQLSFTVFHSYSGSLPPVTDPVFAFPPDLARPDVIFYLDFPDTHFNSYATTRDPHTWKPRTMQVMRHLVSVLPIVIRQMHPVLRCTTEELHRYIQDNFRNRLARRAPAGGRTDTNRTDVVDPFQ